MPSKKTSFESRDPTPPTANASAEHDNPASRRATFEAREPSYTASNPPAKPDSPAESISAEGLIEPDGLIKPEGLTDSGGITGEPSTVAERASFYARDPNLGSSDPLKPGSKKYMGVERRKENRRSGNDRRNDVRFDLEKSDRRQSEGRREGDVTPKFW